MLICDIETVGATVHYAHLALHLGLTGLVSMGGLLFLGLGFRASRRAGRSVPVPASTAQAAAPSAVDRAEGRPAP
jgi:hypothetical protein